MVYRAYLSIAYHVQLTWKGYLSEIIVAFNLENPLKHLKSKTHCRVFLHSKSEKQYKGSWTLHMYDKQSLHLVTPRQRRESDHDDNTALKVEPTFLFKGDYKREIMKS